MKTSSNTLVIYLDKDIEAKQLLKDLRKATTVIARAGLSGIQFATEYPMLLGLKQALIDESDRE